MNITYLLKIFLTVFSLSQFTISAECGHADWPLQDPCNGTCNGAGYCGGTWPCHCIPYGFMEEMNQKSTKSSSTKVTGGEINFEEPNGKIHTMKIEASQSIDEIKGKIEDKYVLFKIVGKENRLSLQDEESKKFKEMKENSCCCGPIGFSCGPCTPSVPGAQIGIGCCCTWQ